MVLQCPIPLSGAAEEGGRDDAPGGGGDAEGVRQDAGDLRGAQTVRTALDDRWCISVKCGPTVIPCRCRLMIFST